MEIQTLNDLLNVVSQVSQRFPTEVWWRGHAKEEWNLHPGVWRPDLCNTTRPKDLAQLERNLTIRFLQGARTRHGHWPEDDYSIQLAMMQHYGLPTRLLDWTESPLFALFFSVKEHELQDGTLWGLSPSALNAAEFNSPMLLSPYKEPIKDLFKAPFYVANTTLYKHAAVVVRHIDMRMSLQMSAFTIHGSQIPLENKTESDKYLSKYVVPAKAKERLRHELFDLGVRESNLFPDLEHLAKELTRMTQDGMIRGEIPH